MELCVTELFEVRTPIEKNVPLSWGINTSKNLYRTAWKMLAFMRRHDHHASAKNAKTLSQQDAISRVRIGTHIYTTSLCNG